MRPRSAVHLCLVVLVAVAIGACGPRDDTAVREDVRRYLQLVRGWAPIEAETARTIDRILKTQFVDDDEVRRQVVADVPRATRHVAEIEAVRPATEPVREIHARYVTAWRNLAAGYRDILDGLDAADAANIAKGRHALEAWREAIVATAADLRRLADESGAAASG